jgi:hypothetical protein
MKEASTKSPNARRVRPNDSGSSVVITFDAKLHRPVSTGKPAAWTFLRLPAAASKALPSRGQVSIDGTMNGIGFSATLEPDGEGGHWMKVDRKLREAAGAGVGDVVTLEISPSEVEPEPRVPTDLRQALSGDAQASTAWKGLTPAARRDFVHWIVSAKQAETRARRIATACDMLNKGKRRPCCFDRSGMYSKSLSCPVADND